MRENGVVYIDKSGGSTYGHKECLMAMVDVKPDALALHLVAKNPKVTFFCLMVLHLKLVPGFLFQKACHRQANLTNEH